jgi:hypothetical protein
MEKSRQHLSADGLISTLRTEFKRIPEHRKNTENINIGMVDAAMSAFAMFSLKSPSLLSFDEKVSEPQGENIKPLYGIKNIPSDTQMRDILDPVDPKSIAPAFKKIFSDIQRGKGLEPYVWDVNNSYLCPIDATGFFSSTNIKCSHCLIKELKSKTVKDLEKAIRKEVKKEMTQELAGKPKKEVKQILKAITAERLARKLEDEEIEIEKVYQHQLLGLTLVHPDQKVTIPFCPEPIINGDGAEKNDCEINAAKRLLEQFRKDHPHLRITIIGDDLYSRAPFLRLLSKAQYDMSFILVAKESSHSYLFESIAALEKPTFLDQKGSPEVQKLEVLESTGEKIVKKITHTFRFVNGVPLNESNDDIKVNFLEHWEVEEYTDKNGVFHKNQNFHSSWITDVEITKDNVYKIMRAGRSRWTIENGVFNTLKNQGYHMGHSYGHGQENLSTNFALLMMLAFLVDQTQELCCKLFQDVRKKARTKYNLWEKVRALLEFFSFESWDMLFRKILYSVIIPASMAMSNTS